MKNGDVTPNRQVAQNSPADSAGPKGPDKFSDAERCKCDYGKIVKSNSQG